MAISTVSIAKTPQARPDIYGFTESDLEDGKSVLLDVMSNDFGGNGKRLYSLDDGDNALKDLLLQDPNFTTAWETTRLGNLIRINNGKIEYKLTQDANALRATEQINDSFVYAIEMGKGTLSYTTVTLTIQGQNDFASIAGDTTGSLTEDDTQPATGTLIVSDVDHDEAHTIAASITNDKGTFLVDADGHWSFTANNASLQHLRAGATDFATFTVTSLDGTAHEDVTITLHGVNDTADITGDTGGNVAEDGQLTTAGDLNVDDVDDGENAFQATTAEDLAGDYGTFTFSATTGAWSYTLDNDAAQTLNSDDVVTDTLTVLSIDGTSKEVTVTITGADEPAPTESDTSPQSAPDPVTERVINWGQNFNLGYYRIEGTPTDLLDNDIFKLNGQITYDGTFKYEDHGNDGVIDTLVYVSSTVGQTIYHATLVLVGVTQFDPTTQIQVV